MKKNLLFLSFWLFLGIIISHAQTGQTEETTVKDLANEKTNAVTTRLNLDENKKKAVYNVFLQTEKRIADLTFGTPDYTKLINYINQERSDMLKTALSPEEYASYQKFYGTSDNNEVNSYIKKNNAFLTKKAAEEAKAQKENEKLMQSDKQRLKKEEDKQKLAEKKAADKEKVAAKKAAAKEKATAKKTATKEKAAAKKAAAKQKAEAKKEKEKQKKAAAKQKALEKKQKELDKKLNKK